MNEQITKPVATAEVAEFLELWEQYYALLQNHRWSSLERYGRDYFSVIDLNAGIAEDTENSLAEIVKLGEVMKAMGEDVAKAATEFKNAEYAYREALKDEAEKPRREWEQAKSLVVKSLEREKRSLAIKLGKLANKRWGTTDAERAYYAEQYDLLSGRKTVVEYTLSDIQSMYYSEHEGTEFTMDLVVKSAGYRRAYINELIAKFGVNALQEADA